MAPSALDLALFHSNERGLYNHLVRNHGCDGERMKWVMALWLWFESIGHHDFVRHVKSYADSIILRFVDEAERCIQCLLGAGIPTDPARREIPLTSALTTCEPIDLGFFDYQRDFVLPGVKQIFNKVCQIIFDDNLMAVIARDINHPANKSVMSSGLIITAPPGEDTNGQEGPSAVAVVGSTPAAPVAPPARTTTSYLPGVGLNPAARPWSPATDASPVDQRSMFITFSRGFPLSRIDISEFFNSRYGHCVETVMIERVQQHGLPPMYGRIIFKSAAMITLVLNGQRTAKFVINGRHLWARMYVPRNN